MYIGLFLKYPRYHCQITMEIGSARHISEISSSIKFKECPSSWNRVVLCGQTEGHDEANNRFSQFFEGVEKLFDAKCFTNSTDHLKGP
jgi:hypothetical protein